MNKSESAVLKKVNKPSKIRCQLFFLNLFKQKGESVAISKVWIEKGCIACGMSESICPEVFKVKHGKFVKGATVIEGVDYSGLEDKIWQAVNACPVELIKYESA